MKYLLCIILPPVACLAVNRKGAFVLNLILTLCLWIPGVIHAFMVVNGAENDRRHQEQLAAIRDKSS